MGTGAAGAHGGMGWGPGGGQGSCAATRQMVDKLWGKRYSSACVVLITLISFHQISVLLITKERICFYTKAESLLCPSYLQNHLNQSLSHCKLCKTTRM